MKIGIMQPYFFPYLGYWQLINAVDRYVVYDDVAYIKGGWINRNYILLDGKRHLITLPLDHSSSFKNINEISIAKNATAITKIFKTIRAAYGKAPYFSTIMPIVEELLRTSSTISELNYHSIIQINQYLSITTEIILSSNMEKDTSLKGEEKVLYINKLLGADTYINAIGGQDLYHADTFAKNGIILHFLKMGDVQYKQFSQAFVPSLSILDILMFNSKDTCKELLEKYDLI